MTARRRGEGRQSIGEALAGKAICVCVGPGGVGKTSSSAAIALGMARRGKRVAVLTIDPAKRLADSLGLGQDELDNLPRRVEIPDPWGGDRPARARADDDCTAGDRAENDWAAGGELWAMMLDPKATFDQVVSRYAEDETARRRILDNRIYRQISGALAGSQEYMAMEKLYEIHETGGFDLLVLDTPPSHNALDFLDAPQRLIRFIDGRSIRLFLRPAGLGARIAGRGTAAISSVLGRLTGLDLLADLSEFFGATSGLIAGMRERAKRVEALLADPATAFVVVTGTAPEPIAEAAYLRGKLREADLPLGAVLVNRIEIDPEAEATDEACGSGEPADANPDVESSRRGRDLAALLTDRDLADRVLAAYEDARARAARDAATIAGLAAGDPTTPLLAVPELAEEITDLPSLSALERALFTDG